jgi:tripartite-type tricarboxylate transporter receptor subunit TctC
MASIYHDVKGGHMQLSAKRIMTFLLSIAFFISFFSASDLLGAPDDYPSRSIQLVIDKAPGDLGDITGRAIAEKLSQSLKVPVVPSNRPAAGGVQAADHVAKAKKDAYTLLYGSAPTLIHSSVLSPQIVPYDSLKDFDLIGRAVAFSLLLVVKSDSPWKSLGELAEYAKKNPRKILCSAPGMGTVGHFNVEIIKSVTGIDFTLVPYEGAVPSITALLGGHVEACSISLGVALPHIKAGKLRGLVISRKSSQVPDIPTAAELGYAQTRLLSSWFGVLAPVGVPKSALKMLTPALETAVNSPEVIQAAERLGAAVDYQNPEEFRKSMQEEFEIVRQVAKKADLIKK